MLEAKLKDVLAFVDGHVKFAETKNAAILAANAALLVGLLQSMPAAADTHWAITLYFRALTAAAVLSSIVSLLSFLPVTQIPWIRRSSRRKATGNLLFFGDIHRLDTTHYLEALARAEGQPNYSPNEWERMYAEQIVANAKIAGRKFAYSGVALWTTMFGVITPVLALPLLLWAHDRDL